jgi:hypothetical protein
LFPATKSVPGLPNPPVGGIEVSIVDLFDLDPGEGIAAQTG